MAEKVTLRLFRRGSTKFSARGSLDSSSRAANQSYFLVEESLTWLAGAWGEFSGLLGKYMGREHKLYEARCEGAA